MFTSPGPWVRSPAPHKLGELVHVYSPSTWEVKAGRSEVQGHQIHNEFWASLDYLRPYFKKANKIKSKQKKNHAG